MAILLAAGAITNAHAQDENAGHGVARISIIAGDVSVQRGDSGERSAAAVNAPVEVGDIVSTAPGARTEVQFDSANMVRLASDSEIRLSDLNRDRYQFQVGRGTVIFGVVRDSQAQVEISTPSVSIRPLKRGAYRISVFDDGHSEITVRVGEADIYTPRGTENLRPGQTMTVRGDQADPEFQTANAVEQDDFDRWNAQRDQTLSRSRSYQYVSPDIDGAQDLDANGRWVNTPDYGTVWSPTVGSDWAPYRNGRWVWEDWYGWTWVSYDSWGWAPFHYGRWFWGAGYGWCWWPGQVYARHYWSPALVGFFGFGGFHAGVGFGGAGFGWVPLAPYETFHPWWGRGFYGGYRNHNVLVNNINIVNNTNITNLYRNARLGNGVTAVNSTDFARGRFTSPMRVTGDQLRSASLVRGQVPIAPTASSLRFSDRAVASPSRNAGFNGRFFSRNQPAPVNRVPFAQQQQSLSQVNRSVAAASGNTPRAEIRSGIPQSAMRGNAPNAPAANSGGWRRYGDSPQAAPAQSPRAVQPSYQPRQSPDAASGGWRRFGEPSQAPRGNMRPQSQAGGWRGANDRPPTAMPSAPGRYQQTRPSDGWRGSQPSRERPAPSYYNRPSYNSPRESSPRALQIAPPIVRERPSSGYQPRSSGGGGHANSSGGGSYRGGGGGGGGGSYHGGGSPSSGGGSHSGGGNGGHGRR
jgi:hypothetical protein